MESSPNSGQASGSGTGPGGDSTPTNVLDFQKSVNKRLNGMTDRQDSIQALSMWMIHHKTECQKIAACWLAAMKRAKVSRRLHLFYLANDVVQSCKKKNAKIYLLAFKNVLKDAVVLVRDAAVKHKIERLFHIWEERNTYFIDFINELRELLNDREKVTAHVSATNFKPQDVVESVRKVKMLETHVGMKQKQVGNLKLDASKIEAVKQLKDRSHSHDFANQFDDSYNKMAGYVKMLENEIEQRNKLIELLENGQTFYEVQNDDAMVVANAYRNFGIRINNLKKRLIDYKDTLADETDSPIPSPSAEAPSPGNTPPQDTGDTQSEEMDMELSDSEDSPSGKIIAAEPYTPSSSNSLTDRLAAMGNNLPGVASDPRQIKLENAGSYSPAEHLKREKTATETTDHKFLFSMVAAKAQPTASHSNKSVLRSLTEFAEKVKNPPPKDWSEYNKKQAEKAKAMAAEQTALAQQALQQQQQQQQQQKLQQSASLTSNPTPPVTSSSSQQSSPSVSQTSLASVSSPQLSATPAESSQSGLSLIQSSSSATSQGEESGGVEEMHSISWPPRNSPPVVASPNRPTRPPRPPQPSNVQVRSSGPPVRPSLAPSSHGTVRTLAPHIHVQEPNPMSNIRVINNVVTVTRAPPPPPPAARVRTISNEQQQDALQLLDSIAAESGIAESNNAGADNHGNPIQTLGNNISLVVNRYNPGVRAMTRPPAPPNFGYTNHRPPAKRPYQQDFSNNYPYYY